MGYIIMCVLVGVAILLVLIVGAVFAALYCVHQLIEGDVKYPNIMEM